MPTYCPSRKRIRANPPLDVASALQQSLSADQTKEDSAKQADDSLLPHKQSNQPKQSGSDAKGSNAAMSPEQLERMKAILTQNAGSIRKSMQAAARRRRKLTVPCQS